MSTCVFNQSKGHFLLNDVLNSMISICLKLKEAFQISRSFDNFMKEEFIVAFELSFLAINIRKKAYGVLDIIFFLENL
jgi:hypothetical protein